MKSFKTELKLNNKQRTLCEQHAGVARYAYNYGLSICETAYDVGESRPTPIDLHRYFVRDEKSKHAWLYDVAKSTPQMAFRYLNEAYVNYFTIEGHKPPTYHKKGQHDKFSLEGPITICEKSVKVPKLGKLRTYEKLPTEAKPKVCYISKQADRWFIAFIVSKEDISVVGTGGPIGVDLGISVLATCSNGKVFANPKAYGRSKCRLAHVQREVARRDKCGKNRRRSNLKVAKLHYRVACIRNDNIHKLTTYLAKNHSEICIEDLNVQGMLKNHNLAGALADSSFGEIRRQLTYKAMNVTVIDQFYPSSQLCSTCNSRQKLKLSQRVYTCTNCGLSIDRDLNASINILNYTRIAQPCKPTDGSCGETPKVGTKRRRVTSSKF